MHRVDLDETGHPAVGDLPREQVPRDHADHLAAGGERALGEQPHQPDLRTAVDDADVLCDQPVGQLCHELAVPLGARRGAQEDRDAHALI